MRRIAWLLWPAALVLLATQAATAQSQTEDTAHPDGAATMGTPREEPSPAEEAAGSAADALLAALGDGPLAELTQEALERNPAVARARAHAAAAAARAPQMAALPDPMAGLTLFALPPETRVGPQRLSLSLTQRLPWLGKLELRERAAVLGAAAAAGEVEAERLRLVTEVRRLTYELGFLDVQEEVLKEEREHLVRHEEAARARYTAGMGLQQGVVKIQAEITRTEAEILALEVRRRSIRASLNALRDQPASAEVEILPLPAPRVPELEVGELTGRAFAHRPELAAATARIARAETLVEVAELEFRPDLNLGLAYTFVDRRRDTPGRLNPPPDNGDDVLALSAGVNLPVRRGRLEAGLTEALEERRAAEEARRALEAEIRRAVGDGAARLPLLYRQWELLERVLLLQAEEALSSAEAAYTTGEVGALDLLDAEHVLFEVRTATARTRADYAVALAALEGAIAGPLPAPEEIDHGHR